MSEKTSESRRNLLKLMGVSGAALALGGLAPLALIKPTGSVSPSSGVKSVKNVASLLALNTNELADGEKIYVGGYYSEGDGGNKLCCWRKGSVKPDNGGTVHNPFSSNADKGRFEVVHGGEAEFRWFGIMDEKKAADEAFLAMVSDPDILKIAAKTNLLFIKRNVITRSHLIMDFEGHTVFTYGIEPAPKDSPASAVFSFTGTEIGRDANYTLKKDMPEYFDTYEVADASQFSIGDWYKLVCDSNAGGSADIELMKLTQVIEVVDATHVRFDYKMGYPLKAGRKIGFQKYAPIMDILIENMDFEGNGRPTTTDAASGSAPFSFEGAVRCDVYNCHARQVFWPMIFRRFNSYYTTEKCSLINPVEIQVGGTGYMTQQIGCMYGVVRDCWSHRMRHLSDFTGCAYSEVENCSTIGDNMGPFNSHGQYEHDLMFIGNAGLVGLTNTMSNWGRSAKNITIKKHSGSAILLQNYCTNITIEDCNTFTEKGMVYAGMIKANVDGLVMRGCHAEKMLMLSQYGERGNRPCLIEGCSFNIAMKDMEFGRIGSHVSSEQLLPDMAPIKSPVTFKNCTFRQFDGNGFRSTGELNFENCSLAGATPEAKPISTEASLVRLTNCEVSDISFEFTGEGEQKFKADRGTKFIGTSKIPVLTAKNAKGSTEIELDDITFDRGSDAVLLDAAEGAMVSRLKLINSTLIGGKSTVSAASYSGSAAVLISGNVMMGFSAGPVPSKNAKNEGNLAV